MKPLLLSLALLGCSPSSETILTRPASTWSATDALTVVAANTYHNLKSGSNVLVMATPFTPDVARALTRLNQIKDGLSDSATYEKLYWLTRAGTGLHIDRDGKMYGRVDSLMVMVTLTNRQWPCTPPTINGRPILAMSAVPCETPSIDDIDRRLSLTTSTGDTMYPDVVWGRRNDILTEDETLLIVFRFTDRSFMKSTPVTLVVGGIGDSVEFELRGQ